MHCDEGKNLFRLIQEARKEAKKYELPVATTPLGIDTPPGNKNPNKEQKEKGRIAEEEVDKAIATYERHVSSCGICPK